MRGKAGDSETKVSSLQFPVCSSDTRPVSSLLRHSDTRILPFHLSLFTFHFPLFFSLYPISSLRGLYSRPWASATGRQAICPSQVLTPKARDGSLRMADSGSEPASFRQ